MDAYGKTKFNTCLDEFERTLTDLRRCGSLTEKDLRILCRRVEEMRRAGNDSPDMTGRSRLRP